jgi:hypothetical protein
MVVYSKKGSKRLADSIGVFYLVMDHEADARELQEALGLVSGKLGSRVDVERRKDAVVLVVGAPKASAKKIRDQVWKRWRR